MRHIGIISDTHGLVDGRLGEIFKDVTLILHAGDVGGRPALEALERIAPVKAVRGNVDTLPLPFIDTITLDSVTILIVHVLESARDEIASRQPDLVLFGHTHRPHASCETRDGKPVILLNPGSAGPQRFDLPRAAGVLTLADSKLTYTGFDLSTGKKIEEATFTP